MTGPRIVSTGYTAGEAAALIAPLAAMTAEEISSYVIVVLGKDMSLAVRSNLADPRGEVLLLAQAITELAPELPAGDPR